MPISVGIVGFEMAQHERVAALIAAVGGPVKASGLIKKTRQHIDNMRKPDARLSIEDLLPLCVEAGVSLDWVATGHQLRPDLADTKLVEVPPIRPAGSAPLTFSLAWLEGLGLSVQHLRYAVLDDAGMAPPMGKGATVLVDARPAQLRSGFYLVDLEHELVARRLNRMPGDRMELIADADPSWHFLIPDGQSAVFHRIVWAGGPL